MDARVGEQDSHTHRAAIKKRPWENNEAPLPAAHNGAVSDTMRGAGVSGYGGPSTGPSLLPPIDAVPYRRSPISRGIEPPEVPIVQYGPRLREPVVKRPRLGGPDYNTRSQLPSALSSGSATRRAPPPPPPPPPRPISSGYTRTSSSSGPDSPYIPSRQMPHDGPAETQNDKSLCRRCNKLATQNRELELYGFSGDCEDCRKNPDLAWVTQAASAGLTQLAETIRTGILSAERGTIRSPKQTRSDVSDCPPIDQFGLKQTLDWILSKINEVNHLADDFVSQVSGNPLENDKKENKFVRTPQDGPIVMKRRIDIDPEDGLRSRIDGGEVDSISDARAHNRRRSLTNPSAGDEKSLPPIRTQHDYRPPILSGEDSEHRRIRDSASLANQPQRRTSMNPPPAPMRHQLPSSPGRSLPSPTSLSYPSPSASSYGPPQIGSRLPPPVVQQSNINNYLPPINTGHSQDSALWDHSSALQHEVSVQKMALSSLQSEHDKLLAAFQRSQTRASALEKKHSVSDNEIITLTEEKMRLQQQVLDLERDVDDLSRSRDEFRQAAVEEGSQYRTIVERASRLEEMASEERRTWNTLKDEMEKKIEDLRAGRSRRDGQTNLRYSSDVRIGEPLQVDTPTSSADLSSEMKLEPTSEPHNERQTSYTASAPEESAEELREEIRRLQHRCAEVEGALRAIRGMGMALVGHAGTVLMD